MKKIFLLLTLVLSTVAFAQYSTPGNYNSYTLDNLVTISDGAVTFEGDYYQFHQDITISPTDTLTIIQQGVLSIDEGVLWTIAGVLIIDGEPLFEIINMDGFANFLGIRFENSVGSSINNANITDCGGIKLVESDVQFTYSQFHHFGQDYSTATIDLFQSNPIISHCTINDNAGPAIASGANGASSPRISNNTISRNVSSNGNYPQINLGTSSGMELIVIDSNIITGQYTNSGGIALSTLAGGNLNAVVRSNQVYNNRYGIALIGSDIDAEVAGNIIVGNNIQNDPMLGGSGINCYGGFTNVAILRNNIIRDNLWGVTIQLNAQPNLGDGSSDSPGYNSFINNGNGGAIYALYNNTPNSINALNNFWGTVDLAEAEDFIYHLNDDLSLGEVFFDPMWINPVGVSVEKSIDARLVPNPASDFVILQMAETSKIRIVNLEGQTIFEGSVEPESSIETRSWKSGIYIVYLSSPKGSNTIKLQII
jgi:hypothetical protein